MRANTKKKKRTGNTRPSAVRITKKLEAEILKAYHGYWDAYLSGDMKTFASLLDDNCHIIGSTAHDTFDNKKDAVAFYKATAKEVAGLGEYRNRNITVLPEADNVMVQEICDYYFLDGKKWHFYGVARISTLFSKRSGSWKIIHQHGSLPDSRAEEGQQLGTEKITKENLQLKEAIKRNTVELQNKNRELEIETSLEKVRAVAMGMKNREDMLKICRTISVELKKLGVKEVRNVQTAIFYPEKGTYMNYEYYAKHDKTFITDVNYTNHKIHKAFALKMIKGKGEFYITHIKGRKKVDDWIAYQKTTNVFIDKYLKTASSLNYYWFALGPVALGISTYDPLTNDGKDLFKRFLNVFELSYRRYLDIEKAEAQAREAQVEAALERVRSKAMAMRKSNDLNEAVAVVFEELEKLSLGMQRCGIGIINKEDRTVDVYSTVKTTHGNVLQVTGNEPMDLSALLHGALEAWLRKDKEFSYILKGKELLDYYKSLKDTNFKLPDSLSMNEEHKASEQHYFTALTKHGGLYAFFDKTLSDEARKVMLRFAEVFNLTYQRFLDLQKAEAQAREAEIQLSLERIRAKTMAMHKSEELLDTAVIISNELIRLSIPHFMSGFVLVKESENKQEGWLGVPGLESKQRFYLPLKADAILKERYENWKKSQPLFFQKVSGKKLKKHLDFVSTYFESDEATENASHFPEQVIFYCGNFKDGYLHILSEELFTAEQESILSRFAKVFEQTYTRFLDLQKAEAQAREAQIEAALERVRSKAMAMHKSSELLETAELLFDQLKQLGAELQGVAFAICDKNSVMVQKWTSIGIFSHPYTIEPGEERMYEAWRNQAEIYEEVYEGERIKKYFELFMEIPAFKEGLQKFMDAGFPIPSWQKNHTVPFKHGYLLIITKKPFQETQIFIRFAKVFEQTYTRFLDLQKAEAQAREAQIEAALERVRSRSMAMHKSDELKEVIRVVLEQFVHLNINVGHAGFYIDYKVHDDMHIWLADPNIEPFYAVIPYFDTPTWNSFLEAKAKGTTLHTDLLDFKEKNKFYKSLFKLFTVPDEAKKFYLQCKGLAVSTVLLENVGLYIENFDAVPYTDEENNILIRFGNVFQQTYTRFLDLQKAEAQARESEIQLALERVRASTAAMHKSDELIEVINTVFQQLQQLHFTIDAASLSMNYKEDPFNYWMAISGHPYPSRIIVPYKDIAFMTRLIADSKKDVPFFTEVFNKEEKDEWVSHILENTIVKHVPEERKKMMYAAPGLAVSVAIEKNIALTIANYSMKPFEDEENAILKRFANVFEQTYTRFLDLQKAEAQAREAQIEAALERVRARAMAMHASQELSEVVHELRKQMGLLGQKALETCVIHLHDESPDYIHSWAGIKPPGAEGEILETTANVPKKGLGIIEEALTAYTANRRDYVIINEGENMRQWFSFLKKESPEGFIKLADSVHGNIDELRAYWSFADFAGGSLLMVTREEPDESTRGLLRRFSNVFGLAYRRFADLKQAEAQAREAQIEAALEKVRSRTLAMQHSKELAETSAELFRQLIGLGIEPNRLYITIVHEENDMADFWITDEDGSKITDAYSANLNDNGTLKRMYEGWKKQLKHLVIDMQGDELQNYFRYLQSINVPFKGGLDQKRRVQHLAYFSKGFIGVASPEEQPAETLQLLERFAVVFNLTFTRFNDLKIAEAHALQAEQDLIAIKEAKQKAEEALTELRATQKQLIQSEKMASLGELTAGIAHEIQNPLNFVNNFSEVSKELLDEMKDELEQGNMEDAKEIMQDVIQNLEKITHHGKRADGIVKGMLQHSRSSSGQKEPTDINALCDEYLRLAYHGLRAKDKSFNAKFETHFDESIERLNIVPQDMGRVILNLINNAFYACTEKQKTERLTQNAQGYEPTVVVSTKKEEKTVTISVKDNGNGIPASVKEKIFQPFFTTKPTGQGTGLGLSLSYDIIKAHGGEIKLETKDGEGSEFIIQLPDA